MKQLLYALCFVSLRLSAQVHEILVTDTSYLNSHYGEDSVLSFSFKNTKNLSGHWMVYYDKEKQHKAMEATYKKGKLTGTKTEWYEDGKIFSEKKCENDTCTNDYFYMNGILMRRDIEAIDAVKGTHNLFYSASYCDNGQIKCSPPLNPDSRSAQFITLYYCNGNKKEESTLLPVSGKHVNIGTYTQWFENGTLKTKGTYDDVAGKKIGFWDYYNTEGKLILQQRYDNNGVLLDKIEY